MSALWTSLRSGGVVKAFRVIQTPLRSCIQPPVANRILSLQYNRLVTQTTSQGLNLLQSKRLSSTFSRPAGDLGFFTSHAFSSLALGLKSSSTAHHATAAETTLQLPPISPPSVSNWLFVSAALVFGVIVVGGITRLTESGLSIVEWRPITGTLPPLSETEWVEEFEKYKLSPEYRLTNHNITLDQFKNIFFWEYAHRLLGRVIGVAFVAPLAYFYARRRLTPGLPIVLTSLGLLIGFQGALGWYMVKSGLSEKIIETNSVPRVSQYRLAAHLSMALLLFAGMLGVGLQMRTDHKWAESGVWNSLVEKNGVKPWDAVFSNPAVRRFRLAAGLLTGLVFLTAFSGAFVAGLDAGLIYNEFPYMGESFMPPIDEMYKKSYAKEANGSDLWWRNIFENPTTTQFDHRLLATTTYAAISTLFFTTILSPLKKGGFLPALPLRLTYLTYGLVNLQVLLGISTLLYLVPVELAASHQAGSVALLGSLVALIASLRKPGRMAQLWRDSRRGTATR
ncbi:cytochrome oxidase assembly protein-domain-containing protein [Cantharellus anzutake]|uniref:cytochrome oxidase assembly protein-domain-containing protein n=1 Tax=Cantharellus anzutake TaxID=1750568 RepID=UPI0019069A04|nr:cytochrome oxidase assembly protein-domain-containing protein [Cantharellus anzutake]KAF8342033.1 cytochrome oxidase assembly protein-domain-containing protein [Cantharellus anzutake]